MADKAQGRKGKGLIEAITKAFKDGDRDFATIASKTGATESTVRTQFYRQNYKVEKTAPSKGK